jgi:hypothetical protein
MEPLEIPLPLNRSKFGSTRNHYSANHFINNTLLLSSMSASSNSVEHIMNGAEVKAAIEAAEQEGEPTSAIWTFRVATTEQPFLVQRETHGLILVFWRALLEAPESLPEITATTTNNHLSFLAGTFIPDEKLLKPIPYYVGSMMFVQAVPKQVAEAIFFKKGYYPTSVQVCDSKQAMRAFLENPTPDIPMMRFHPLNITPCIPNSIPFICATFFDEGVK